MIVFLEALSNPQASLLVKCLAPGKDYVYRQISMHSFAPSKGYRPYS